jgi:hypothetical protein
MAPIDQEVLVAGHTAPSELVVVLLTVDGDVVVKCDPAQSILLSSDVDAGQVREIGTVRSPK